MGCFLGCFGGEKDHNRRKRRTKRSSPLVQRNRVQNVQQDSVTTAEQANTGTPPTNLVPELINKPAGEEQLSPSPRKRVTFNSNVTTYEHVSVQESINSLPECNENVGKVKQEDLKGTSSQSHSLSEDDSSVISSVGSYPPNHRYHNARDSDDETEEYGDSDLDDFVDSDDEDGYGDYDEHIGGKLSSQEVWSESVLTTSMESRTENPAAQKINDEVESHMVKRNGYTNSVLNPIENITQWKAAKSRGAHPSTRQKENSTANFEAPRASFSSEPMFNSKSHQLKTENQETAVDASLSNWLVSPPETMVSKKRLVSVALKP